MVELSRDMGWYHDKRVVENRDEIMGCNVVLGDLGSKSSRMTCLSVEASHLYCKRLNMHMQAMCVYKFRFCTSNVD